MLYIFLGADLKDVRATMRHPIREYLRRAVSLELLTSMDGGRISGGHRIDPTEIPDDVMDGLL
jgi:hypothetical protein